MANLIKEKRHLGIMGNYSQTESRDLSDQKGLKSQQGSGGMHFRDNLAKGLSINSSATISFTNGAVVNYTAPGVYTINGLPAAVGAGAVGTAGGASAAATAGIVVGAAALGALGVENAGEGEEVPPDQPISR